ncbi:MAG: TSUP family transporter [Pseudomonadota bacterium]
MALFEAYAPEALIWIAAAGCIAGLVRGFSGFGTAMIFLPVAGQHLSPFAALTAMVVMDIVGPLIMVPRALKAGQPADVLRLGLGLALAMPLGVWLLTLVEPAVFRYGVSLFALGLLAVLIAGLRYAGPLTPPMVLGTGALGGALGGSVGLPGPPVILLYMASPLPAAAIRANITLYLILADLALLALLWGFGELVVPALALGAALIVPYVAGNRLGSWMFVPGRERTYRAVAYAIIAASALSGLPVWD